MLIYNTCVLSDMMSTWKSEQKQDLGSSEKIWKSLDPNSKQNLKSLNKLIKLQCKKICAKSELRKISKNWGEINELLKTETMRAYDKAKLLKLKDRIIGDEMKDNRTFYNIRLMKHGIYIDLYNDLLSKWKSNIDRQERQTNRLTDEILYITYKENKIRRKIKRREVPYKTESCTPIVKPPFYLKDHQTEYNATIGSSDSEEDNLGDAQPTTDSEDDDL